MKRITLVAVLLALAAIPAFAQSSGFTNYHYNANMNCSDCHSMHASAHRNLTDGSAITTPNTTPGTDINPYYVAPAAPAEGRHHLLKNDDVCATCHDGQTFAPDVIGDNTNSYIRSAGGLREGTTGGGHKIGSTVRPPGYDGASVNNYFAAGSVLECYSCHSPHGGTAFRNLGPYQMRGTIGMAAAANVLPEVLKSTTWPDLSVPTTKNKDVVVALNTYTFGTDPMASYYGRDKVAYGRARDGEEIVFAGTPSSNRMDHFCGVCHGKFHGGQELVASGVSDGTGFVRHPTSIVKVSAASTTVFGAQKGAQTLKVYQMGSTINPATDSPGCVTCHKAHGNNNPFALIFPDRVGGTVPSEEGGGIYKDLCKSCHSMGGV